MNGSRSFLHQNDELLTLTDYLRYWSLRRRPFLNAQQDFFFAGTAQRSALAQLNREVSERRRLVTLLAPRGAGSTRLLQQVGRMRGLGDCAVESVLSEANSLGRREPGTSLAASLGIDRSAADPADAARKALQRNRRRGIRTLWLIDRADLTLLHRLDEWTREVPAITVVVAVAADRALLRKIIDLNPAAHVRLTAMPREDTGRYLDYALQHAGASQSVFSEAAVDQLHQRCGGLVSELALAAESALALAAHLRRQCVTADLVDQTESHQQVA